MNEPSNTQLADFHTILANQRALGKRFLWLLIVPFVLTAVVVAMFFFLTARLTNVEVLAKRMDIDFYLQQEQNYAWAVKGYEDIAKAHPGADILARLGLLYYQADPKNKEIAIETLNRAKLLNSKSWTVYRSLTFIYSATDQTKKAIQAGQMALALNDLDFGTYNNLAWTYATTNDSDLRNLQPKTYALKAVELTHNKHAEYFDTLAQVYVAMDDRDDAVWAFRQAIALVEPRRAKISKRLKQYFPDENL